jgi:phospholipase/carboxylesterase
MLALDVALAGTPGVDRVAALSGVLLMDSVPGLTAPHATRPRFLLTHGRQDRTLPFAGAVRAKEMLEAHGFQVSWRPFDGGHAIPDALLPDIERFLFA